MSRSWFGCIVVFALSGCGEGPRPADTTCDLLADGGCHAPARCRLVAGGEARCLTDEPTPRMGCTAASCPAGQGCVAVEGLVSCRPICALASGAPACPADQLCAYAIADAAGIGVCAAPCTLREGCADPRATCAPSTAAPFPVCIGVGPATEGDACEAVRCGEGLACLSDDATARCARLCEPGAFQCPAGECEGEIAGFEGLGYCVPPRGG